VFLIEVAGALDAHKQMLEDTLIYLYESVTGRRPTDAEIQLSATSRPTLTDLIQNLFRLRKADRWLPGIRIIAGIHAAIRYRDQPNRKGDIQDHFHARGALPYCTAFLTEKNLGNLLTRPPLEYDQLFDCRVLWQDDEILSFLRALDES
jgi:hypothetical protein